MTPQDARALIGKNVASSKGRIYTVLDVTDEREDGHNVWLSGGQIIPLEDFEKMFTAVQNALQ